jgi:lipopolysaccharide/colanic/teichoic acid biosynthesis glycosyltransferase
LGHTRIVPPRGAGRPGNQITVSIGFSSWDFDVSLHDDIILRVANIGPRMPTRPSHSDYAGIKRAIDIGASILVILLCLPLLGLIAAFVRFDSPGPVLFRQRRGGLGGKPFAILKFRTMTVLEDGEGVVQAQRHDLRITRVGRFLRPLFLDELPQLFNVLGGDMSLVGPRPHAVTHDAYYGSRIESYDLRHTVKPGITGMAQISGARGPTPLLADMHTRVKLDLWYVEHACLSLDLLILAKTPLEMLRRM